MTWTIAPCAPDDAAEISAALGVDNLTASVLARRGYADVEGARAFLEGADPGHDPLPARGYGRRLRAHPRGGRRG